MGCAFDLEGTCSLGIMNLFGCPKNCSHFMEKTDVVVDLEIYDEDKFYINLCRKIQKFVSMGRITIDTDQHKLSDNKHLMKFLDLCGLSSNEIILKYLATIQPFQLIRDNLQEYGKEVYCVLDISYGIALYLKLVFSATNGLVVSFHENQLAKTTKYLREESGLCYAITKTDVPIGSTRILPVSISHGLLTFKLDLVCLVVDSDLVKISIGEVYANYLKYANDKVMNLTGKTHNTFSSVKNLTFTSYGETLLNDVSILLDALCLTAVSSDEKVGLITALNLKLKEIASLPNAVDYIDALDARYSKKLGSVVKKPRIYLGLR